MKRRDLPTEFGATAPVRLDFAGGWTDVLPFSAREGGIVVNAAIELTARVAVRRGTPDPARVRGPGPGARVRRRGRVGARRPARSAEGRAPYAPGAGGVHDHHALRCAAWLGTRQLGGHGRCARGGPRAGAW